MSWKLISNHRKKLLAGVGLIFAIGAGASYSFWWPPFSTWIDSALQQRKSANASADAHAGHDHSEGVHDDHAGHDHAGHDEGTSLELNAQALKNLGLTNEYLQPIALRDYNRTITVPAIVAAKPGRTQIRVSSPLSGVVTHVHAVTGEAVIAGELLFEVRLTYEDLVDTQTQFLKTLSELEVEKREIARLEEVTQSGAISAKSLLERRYSKDKIEAYLGSMREALKLHGLSAAQIASIETERKLLRDLAIETPDIDSHNKNEEMRLSRLPFRPASFAPNLLEDPKTGKRPLIVEDLNVQKGQGVTSGEMLCSLSDFSSLYIEGQAFEQDAPTVTQAAQNGWMIDAIVQTNSGAELINGLKLAFVGTSVDPSTRTLSFFVELPNQILRDEENEQGQRFLTWRFRVGQRLQLQVPVEVWKDQLVLPVDAVVKDGADWFAFQQNGDHFDRIAVHVKHRDQTNVVIDNDGVLFPGDVVALRAAHQLQMALKNKSGGGVDPHAGHNH
ncbi:MAG: efflux RND transporter periplasmic adaptor subunit [Planctomycetes bacterium]|nr:efflux RND transporter periplasmic adaptor subunit [Planctomycetota bacterium]